MSAPPFSYRLSHTLCHRHRQQLWVSYMSCQGETCHATRHIPSWYFLQVTGERTMSLENTEAGLHIKADVIQNAIRQRDENSLLNGESRAPCQACSYDALPPGSYSWALILPPSHLHPVQRHSSQGPGAFVPQSAKQCCTRLLTWDMQTSPVFILYETLGKLGQVPPLILQPWWFFLIKSKPSGYLNRWKSLKEGWEHKNKGLNGRGDGEYVWA